MAYGQFPAGSLRQRWLETRLGYQRPGLIDVNAAQRGFSAAGEPVNVRGETLVESLTRMNREKEATAAAAAFELPPIGVTVEAPFWQKMLPLALVGALVLGFTSGRRRR